MTRMEISERFAMRILRIERDECWFDVIVLELSVYGDIRDLRSCSATSAWVRHASDSD
ncbi:MAG TPA: hypothetical protein VJ603_08615 [Paucimonas sp.]|nr:hypothetical protein [Paucimonas sp.]HJW54973.1 hypothetical protein [Burkholderiaceae bacterium]